MIKSVAKPFHASDLEEQRVKEEGDCFTRKEAVVEGGRALDLGGKGEAGPPLPNHGPSVHADRHLPKSQKADKRERP